jgi:hypothetical protein
VLFTFAITLALKMGLTAWANRDNNNLRGKCRREMAAQIHPP